MFDFRLKSQNEILNFYFSYAFSVNILFSFLLAKEKQKALFFLAQNSVQMAWWFLLSHH